MTNVTEHTKICNCGTCQDAFALSQKIIAAFPQIFDPTSNDNNFDPCPVWALSVAIALTMRILQRMYPNKRDDDMLDMMQRMTSSAEVLMYQAGTTDSEVERGKKMTDPMMAAALANAKRRGE